MTLRSGAAMQIVLALFAGSCSSNRSDVVAEVPFSAPRHQIVVQVTLDGQGPFNMLLDTGTDPAAIDAELARRLRAPVDSTLHQGEGAGSGPIEAFEWDMVRVRLGAIEADTVPAAALDLSQIGHKLGTPIHGVLGFGFLEGRIVQIDYPRHRVRFLRRWPSVSRQAATAEFSFLADSIDPTPRFSAHVGSSRVMLLYDSGSSGALSIAGQATHALGLDSAFAAARIDSAFGYGGRAETRQCMVPALTIGPLHYTNVPCTFGVRAFGALDDTSRVVGKIGNALFEDAIVTLDYARQQMRIQRPVQ